MATVLLKIGFCHFASNLRKHLKGFHPFYGLEPFMSCVIHVSASLGQSSSVVTFDLAIYSKAKEIQWRYPNEFKDLTIRIGGFHIALNFLSVIGKQFEESGIEELLIESSLYGNATAAALLTGKSCNRGVRAHKLIMEALLRLQWRAFCEWLQKAENTLKLEALQMDKIVSKLANCRDAIVENKLQEILPNLCESLKEIHPLFYKFCRGCTSPLSVFWNS